MDVRDLLTKGARAQAAADRILLEACARENPNAKRELERLRRIEDVARRLVLAAHNQESHDVGTKLVLELNSALGGGLL